MKGSTQLFTGILRACYKGKVPPVCVHFSLPLVSESLQLNEEGMKEEREGNRERRKRGGKELRFNDVLGKST